MPRPRWPTPSYWRCTCRRRRRLPGQAWRTIRHALRFVDRVPHELAVALECRDNIQLLTAIMAGANRSAVDHQAGPVQPAHGDDAARHILIAAGDRDIGVVPLSGHDGFDRVGNEIAGLQRIAHPLRAHRDAIADADRIEAEADEAGRLRALLHLLSQAEKVHIAGVALKPHAGDPDLRLIHIFFAQSGGIEHGLRRALRFRLRDLRSCTYSVALP